jgi:hypothetical protein
MAQPESRVSGEQIVGTMIELARCSPHHRIIVAGSNDAHQLFHLHRRGYNRVATTATRGLPCGQFQVALVDWQLQPIRAFANTLNGLVPFLAPESVLVVWLDSGECADHGRLRSILEKAAFRVEAGTRCEGGIAVSARRYDASLKAIAA